MIKDKNFYNEAAAQKLGWEPFWFGAQEFDSKLVKAIQEYQKKNALTVDGLCGPTTYRRIFTERQAIGELSILQMKEKCAGLTQEYSKQKKYIICNGKEVPIEWDKVVDIFHPDALILKPGQDVNTGSREVKQFVVHWDGTLSSKLCHEILKKRNLSVQFSIDNDGTIYQFTDANDVCWHAPPVNFNSVGVEISNAVNPKYQSYYKAKSFGERPLINCPRINGKFYFNKILGFYPVQIEALRALIKAVVKFYPDIQLQTPSQLGLHLPMKKQLIDYSGIVAHYHVDLDKEKWDTAGLDLSEVILKL